MVSSLKNSKGYLILVAAPSGAGKTSLVRALTERYPDELIISVSHTTRECREGEVDGECYHFISKSEFQRLIEEKHFLEYATVFDNFYGTSRDWVEEKLDQGKHVILEIDWQGAAQIRKLFSNNLSIFILPPSYEVLEERLRGRGNDAESVIVKRMQGALEEISHFDEFDQVIVNDDFEEALDKLETVVRKSSQEDMKAEHFSDFVKKLIEQGTSR